MGLTISKTDAQIGINRTPSRMEIEKQNARLELHQKQARVNIKTERPKVLIDQYEAFASSGLKNMTDLTRETAQLAYQSVMQYIGKVAEDGDRLAAIEKGGDPLADIAERDAFPEKEFGYDYMPKTGPKFDVTGSLKIDPERNWEGVHNGVEARYTPGQVNINFSPAKVEIYMKQYASIKFQYIDNKVDYSV